MPRLHLAVLLFIAAALVVHVDAALAQTIDFGKAEGVATASSPPSGVSSPLPSSASPSSSPVSSQPSTGSPGLGWPWLWSAPSSSSPAPRSLPTSARPSPDGEDPGHPRSVTGRKVPRPADALCHGRGGLTVLPFILIKTATWLLSLPVWYFGSRIMTAINPNGHVVLGTVLLKTPEVLFKRRGRYGA